MAMNHRHGRAAGHGPAAGGVRRGAPGRRTLPSGVTGWAVGWLVVICASLLLSLFFPDSGNGLAEAARALSGMRFEAPTPAVRVGPP